MADGEFDNEINIQALLGRNLKRLRNNAKLSQMELASITNISSNFINDIENGKKWGSAKTIAKLAKALKARPYQFFINESDLNEKEKDNINYFLNDITDNLTNVVKEYRKSYFAFDPEEEKKN